MMTGWGALFVMGGGELVGSFGWVLLAALKIDRTFSSIVSYMFSK
jgi:hypothetical protein